MKNNIHTQIENGIEYLVFESKNYYYMNRYQSKNKLPRKYKKYKYTKYVISRDNMFDVEYYYENLLHNIYNEAVSRYIFYDDIDKYVKLCTGYYIYGEQYNNKEAWKKDSNIILRKNKLKKLNMR